MGHCYQSLGIFMGNVEIFWGFFMQIPKLEYELGCILYEVHGLHHCCNEKKDHNNINHNKWKETGQVTWKKDYVVEK